MGAQENKEFIRRYLETISGQPKTEELLNQFIAEQPLKDHIALYEASFPRYEMHIEKMVAEDDLVSVIGFARLTNTGPFMGNPPTGKTFDLPFHITYRVEGGKIVEHWLIADSAVFMQGLGLAPNTA